MDDLPLISFYYPPCHFECSKVFISLLKHFIRWKKKKNGLCYLAFFWPYWFLASYWHKTLSAALNVNTEYAASTPLVKGVYIHSPNASTILLPDGRYLGYQEQGVPAVRARYSMIAPHSFLSSRLSGRILIGSIWILQIMREEQGNSGESLKIMPYLSDLLHFPFLSFPLPSDPNKF